MGRKKKTFCQLSELQDIASTPPPRSGAATDANTGGKQSIVQHCGARIG